MMGTDATHASAPWLGETRYARPLADAAALLAGTLPDAPGTGLWLTSFEDASSKRVDADLWFGPSPATTEVVPPASIQYSDATVPLPLDVLAGVVLLVRWFVVRRRPRRVSSDT
jgi:hypothetical protein